MRARIAWLFTILALGLAPGARAQTLSDPSLVVDSLAPSGLAAPTSMAFVAPNDFLVLNKAGFVKRVLNGVIQPGTVLNVLVDNNGERGLLGIAVDTATPKHVFLYYSEAATAGGPALANRIYRYDWNPGPGTLTNPSLVLELPVTPATNHNGGVLALGPPGQAPGVGDGSLLYAVIGDLDRRGQLQNVSAGPAPDNTSVILRVRQNGTAAPGNPFTPYCSVTTTTTCTSNASCPGGEVCRTEVARYYGYGVRNSFGLALDPVTGALWDTENGALDYDEVNRVTPGANSGWVPLMGPDARSASGVGDLFHMPGAGVTYSDPEFSWLSTIAPTGIVLPHHSSLGPVYDRSVLVGDANFGRIHAFPLNAGRTALDVGAISGLADLVADSVAEVNASVLGTGFGSITDLEMGPDGHLYVVSLFPPNVFRVRGPAVVPALPDGGVFALLALISAGALLAVRARRATRARQIVGARS
jgi:glucose/arabinose dehydrogenase